MSRILLVSNEKSTSAILTKLLKTEGYKVVSAVDAAAAKKALESEKPNLMIATSGKGVDADMAVEVIAASRALYSAMPIIVICESDGGVSAARFSDFRLFACIEKPLKVDKLVASVQKAVDQGNTSADGNVNLNLQLEACYQFENIVAESPAMKSVCEMISRVAGTDVTILVSGEQGTGKELVAKTIHANSRRKDKNLVVVNCAGPTAEADLFAHGGIENANTGTLVLQDIHGLSPSGQQTLLKCLQERKIIKSGGAGSIPVDVRIVATTGVNLQQLVAGGTFLADLYKLIRIILIQIAPLRDRRQDIMPTVLQVLRRKVGEGKALPALDNDVKDILQRYSWPGNVTEIEAVMEHALKAATAGKLTKANLPADVAGA